MASSRIRHRIIRFTAPALLVLAYAAGAQAACDLKVGTIVNYPPYMSKDASNKEVGLDIDLGEAILKGAGCTVTYVERPWKRIVSEIENGTLDMTFLASKTAEREKFAEFSEPYRTEFFRLAVRSGESSKFPMTDLSEIGNLKFRLGTIIGFNYSNKVFETLSNPSLKNLVAPVEKDEININKLLAERIDGLLIDPGVFKAVLAENNAAGKIELHPLPVPTDVVHLMFSKKSVSPETVQAVNESLKKVIASGKRDEIVATYLKQFE